MSLSARGAGADPLGSLPLAAGRPPSVRHPSSAPSLYNSRGLVLGFGFFGFFVFFPPPPFYLNLLFVFCNVILGPQSM